MLHSDQGFKSLNIKGRNFSPQQRQEERLLHRFGNQNHGKTHNLRSLGDALPCFDNSNNIDKETDFLDWVIRILLLR